MADETHNTPDARPKCLLDECVELVWRQQLCRDHFQLAWEDDLIEFEAEGPPSDKWLDLATRPKPPAGRVGGFVYVMQCGDRCKVGISHQPEDRRQTLQSGMGQNVELVFSIEAEYSRGVEVAAHRLLAPKHSQGEWFNCTPAEAIEAVLGGMEKPANVSEPLPKPESRPIRLRPVGFYDRHRMPKTKINKNGRKHPDFILE